mmetsp:Transcript_33324/g.77415  ORF Transcript_33324/g.77415 Transcript_33324/m.77415 type:complete len:224 (+) Transcript_33324:2148-2819(+)
MNSLQSSFHLASCSLRCTSQLCFVWRSAFTHSSFSLLSSSTFSLRVFGGGALPSSAMALRFAVTKIPKGDLGGGFGASERNRSVTTLVASFMYSILIFFSKALKPKYFLPSLKACMSSTHLTLSSLSLARNSSLSSSGACAYFCISAERPLPSPLPGGTSLLCSSAYMEKAFFGRFGVSRKLTSLFSLALAAWRSSRYSVYCCRFLNSRSSFWYSSLSSVALA